MTKYVIVDIRTIEKSLEMMKDFLKRSNIDSSQKLLPILLAKIDDYMHDSGIWDLLADSMSTKDFENLEYDQIDFCFQNMSEVIKDDLNILFNMPDNTFYYFDKWIGNDVKLEIVDDH